MINDKLKNFPPVYYVSLEDSFDRQSFFENQFKNNGIENVHMVSAYDGRKTNFCEENSIVDGVHFNCMNPGEVATTITHLKAIIEWYKNSDSEYAIFFEDDMSLETVNYWNFTWDEFMNILPDDWNVIQLSLIKSEIDNNDMKLNYRHWDINWSAGSYMIKRSYASQLIDFYFKKEKYYLKISYNSETIPVVETCIFTPAIRTAYTIPLFVESVDFISTFYGYFLNQSHKNCQIDSSNYVKYWWKIKGKDLLLDYFRL